MPKGSFLIFCLIFIAISFSLSATAALIPTIAKYFGVTSTHAVRLTWLYMLPYSIVAFLWGPLSRSVTIKRLLLLATCGFFLSALFFGLSQTIRQAFVFRLIMGCFGSSFMPLAFITIGKAVSGEKKAKYLGIFFALSTLSACIGVFLSGFLPWQAVYLIPALLNLVIFILVAFYLEDFDFRSERFRISYVETFKNKQALHFFIIIALGSFLYHSLQQNFGVYLSERFSLKQMAISSIFTIATMSAVIIRFLGGFLTSSFGTIKTSQLGFVLMGIFALVLLIVGKYYLLFLLIILWGAGWALAHIGLSTHLTQMPDKILRDASSINSSLRLGFGGFGALMGGLLASSMAGFKVLFFLVAVSSFWLGFYLKKVLLEGKECYGQS